jgi:hypothetical protein
MVPIPEGTANISDNLSNDYRSRTPMSNIRRARQTAI